MKPHVILIADAGGVIGWGHAVRQLALATALVERGVRTLFVTRTREALALDWPCPVWRVESVERCILPNDDATVVYDLAGDETNDDAVGTFVRFEDYGRVLGNEVEHVVCPQFGAAAHEWGLPALLGPRFAPLREPFREYAPAMNKSGVFVYGPAPELPESVRGTVQLAGFNARRNAHAMRMSTLALVPPSMIALECLAIGTPVVLYVPGPKWQPIADAMVAAGVAKIWSGRADDHTLGCVLADDGMRRRMSEAGREAVDGRGAERLAEWLADA